ncbi:uncharacterized protein N7484_002949 [Penicillium longicatenatum]|uniref:uncharacterized protein n=1 Tax=Penicillium longicatenatum TaxID=1561947 RepID=UPI0025496175|nr:uncharacterized protein N7484_002949 [Penicillium longicatenatum]KAJ5649226.1 hypothetical protein N7484_002949 [Penicillium longicatenatum]
MSWTSVFSRQPREPGSSGSSRVFIYLGLAVISLLLSYQLVLNHDSLGSIASWKVGSQASGAYDPDADYDGDGWAAAAMNGSQTSKTTNSVQQSVPIPAYTSTPATPAPISTPTMRPVEKELVIAAMKKSDMSWVEQNVPADWITNIYRADAAEGEAEFTVPDNKGNEAMVYLTHIIDRYDTLPDVNVFLHGGRYQWHNDNPLYDSVISIKDLQLNHVRNAGYVNLRCTWIIGCPAELEPARYLRERPDDPGHPTAVEFPDSFMALFPGEPVPDIIGVPCCSQFAVSREAIRARGKEEYVRMRDWLLNSPLDASTSGRIFEYSWHIMFGKTAQYCLDAAECYCNTYGYCNMTDADLQNQWVWKGMVLPEGWPEKGWPEE